ncbi:MAG: Fe-S cluster assembly protein SufD [Sneathiella sp.]|nr:MAG: Fe-S cluster assembly protein SufD [Sneathiella sp.]
MNTLTPLAQDYLSRFDTAIGSLPGHQSSLVTTARQTARDIFARQDFPNKRVEEWRFTNLASLTKGIGDDIAEVPSASASIETPHVMTFVNGRFDAGKSSLDGLPDGIRLTSLAAELDAGNDSLINNSADHRAVVALNTAFMEDGYVLDVAANITLDQPLRVRFVSASGSVQNARHMRNIIRLGDGSSLTLLEEHTAEDGHSYFANPMTDITLEDGANFRHYKLQDENLVAYHLANTDCLLKDNATYENFSLAVGAKLSRNELTTTIVGAGATSILNGAYLMRGQQHSDTTTVTNHLVPENDSRQVYKGVLDDDSRGVFQGKIHIAENAQQVSGDQLSKALLLSDRATMACKPELQIYADDVKCSHGATSGELDEDALFYLQSRGIDAVTARKMLIEAFLADAMDEISDEAVKVYFSGIATAWLQKA